MGQVYSYSLIPGPTPAFGDPSTYNSLKLKQHQELSRKNQLKKISGSQDDWNKSIGFLSTDFQNLQTEAEQQQQCQESYSTVIDHNGYHSNQYNSRNLLSSNPDILNDDLELDTQSHHGLIKPKLIVKSQRRNKVSSILASARSYLLSSSSSTSSTNPATNCGPQAVVLRPTKLTSNSKSHKSKIGCFNHRNNHDYDKHKNGHDLIRSNKGQRSSILPVEILEPEVVLNHTKKNAADPSSNGIGFFDLKNNSRNRGIRLFPVNSNIHPVVTGSVVDGTGRGAERTNKISVKRIDFNNISDEESEGFEDEEITTTSNKQLSQRNKNNSRQSINQKKNSIGSKVTTSAVDYQNGGGFIKNPLVAKLSREEEEKEKEILSRGMSNSFSCYNLHRETLVSNSSASDVDSQDNPSFRKDSILGMDPSRNPSNVGSTSTNQSLSEENSSIRRSSIGEDEEAPFIDDDVEDENGELVSPTSLNCKISHQDSQMSRERGLQEQSSGMNGMFSRNHGLMRNPEERDQVETEGSSSSASNSSSVATSLINDWRVKKRIQPELPPAVPPFPNPIPKIQLQSPTNCQRTSVKCYQGQMQAPQKPMVFLTSSNKERNATNPMYQETRNGKLVNANGTINRNKTVIQASTSELLRALGDYIEAVISSLRNPNIEFNTHDLAFWLRSVDRSLLIQGWQEIAFVNPANLVFLYLLLRDMIQECIRRHKLNRLSDLQSLTLTCLYISYGYMGNEISYPLKPFLCESDSREDFFDRALFIINRMSGKMLQINADPSYFTSTFSDLLLGNQHQQQKFSHNSKPVPFNRSTSSGSYKSTSQSSSHSFGNGHQHQLSNGNGYHHQQTGEEVVSENRNQNHSHNTGYYNNGSSKSHPLTSSNSSNLNNNLINNNVNPMINIR